MIKRINKVIDLIYGSHVINTISRLNVDDDNLSANAIISLWITVVPVNSLITIQNGLFPKVEVIKKVEREEVNEMN